MRLAAGGAAILGLFFLAAGAAKLLALPAFTQTFADFGLPRWTLVPVGVFEALSGGLLLIPSTRFFGALGVCAAMVGAATVHLMTGVMLPAIFVNGVLFGAAAWIMSKSGREQYPFGAPGGGRIAHP